MKCPNCERDNRAGAKFCEECGTPLAHACASADCRFPRRPSFAQDAAIRLIGSTLRSLPLRRARQRRKLTLQRHLRREDPHIEGRARRRAQAGHGVVCRCGRGRWSCRRQRPGRSGDFLDPVIGQMMEAIHRFEGAGQSRYRATVSWPCLGLRLPTRITRSEPVTLRSGCKRP